MQNFLITIFLVIMPLSLNAHDFWIEPSKFIVSTEEQVPLTLREGKNFSGNSIIYISDWFQDFSIEDSSGHYAIKSQEGDDPAGTISFKQPGIAIAGYHGNPDFTVHTAPEFDELLKKEHLDDIAPMRKQYEESDKDATEYFTRCSKTILQAMSNTAVADDDDDYQRVTQALGHPIEITPSDNPMDIYAGGRLNLTVRFRGQPLANRTVVAYGKSSPETRLTAVTNDQGGASLELPRRDTWFIKTTHMIRLTDDPKADWHSYWASMLFSNQK